MSPSAQKFLKTSYEKTLAKSLMRRIIGVMEYWNIGVLGDGAGALG
jgi:hypothetical protein